MKPGSVRWLASPTTAVSTLVWSATAALPNAELLVVPDMGHNLPRGIWPTLIAAISRLADRAEALPTSTVAD